MSKAAARSRNNFKYFSYCWHYRAFNVPIVKAVAGKKPFSYDMTPNSPEPSMDWRDSNTNKKALKPLVKVSVPPRMPKRKKSNGLLALLKSIFTLSFLRSSKKKKKVQPRKRKNYNKNSRSTGDKPRNPRNLEIQEIIRKIKFRQLRKLQMGNHRSL